MAFAPLLLTGGLEIGGVDVSEQVTSFMIKASRDSIEVPATFGARKSFFAGNDSYELEIEYLQDVDATALSQIFWDAIGSAAGTVTFSGTLKDGAVSATNPEWSGTVVVTSVGLSGEVNTVGVDSVTFPIQGRPAKAVA